MKDSNKEEKRNPFDEIPEHIRERVLGDIGHASMCWDYPERAGIFDSEEAAKIGIGLCQFIIEQLKEAKK